MPDEYFQSSLTAQQIETVLTQNQNSVLYTSQTLTNQQKNIARNNIGAYSKPSEGIPKTDLVSAVQTSLGKADTAYQKPSGGIPKTDLVSAVQTSLGKADTAYQKPSGGIPKTDLVSAVQTSLGKADTAYQKPSGGIPKTDLVSAVQTSLGKADTAYQKPSGGIPSSDLSYTAIAAQNNYGTCSSNADDPYKVVTINSGTITSLTNGLCIRVRFSYGSSRTAMTSGIMQLNLNGLGNHVFAEEFTCESDAVIDFVYSTDLGGKWVAVSDPSAYRKPSNGIPKTDLASAVQTSLGKADTAYQKPSGGIPSSDLALSAIVGQNNFGVCSTAADSPTKEVTINSEKITSLTNGLCIRVKFSNGSSSTAMTSGMMELNLNGLGSRPFANEFTCSSTAVLDFVYHSSTSSWNLVGGSGGGGSGGTSDYSDLTNKPSINNVTLTGNKTTSDLGLYSKPSSGIPKTDLASAVQTSLGKADTAYQMPSGGIPKTGLASAVQTSLGKADTAYQKPSGGIPDTDLASAVQSSLSNADSAYQKPAGGIPDTDLASAVQTSLGKADTAYQKPSGGIPSTDLASSVQASLNKADTATIPSGGSAGQVLKKNSSTDYDVFWANESGGGSGGGGTSNYSDLVNKPMINGVTLSGNKSSSALGIRPVVNIYLLCDDDETYQDSPSGTFSIYDPDWSKDMSEWFWLLDSGAAVPKLIYGRDGYRYEVYDLMRAENNMVDGYVYYTLLFRTISFKNGEIVLKSVTVTGVDYDYISNATVTYSEAIIGVAPSANGVSF